MKTDSDTTKRGAQLGSSAIVRRLQRLRAKASKYAIPWSAKKPTKRGVWYGAKWQFAGYYHIGCYPNESIKYLRSQNNEYWSGPYESREGWMSYMPPPNDQASNLNPKTKSMNSAKSPTPGSALVATRDRKKLEAIGKKMETLLKQVDELFGDARDIIGFEQRDECYTEELADCDYWDDMGKALVRYAIESRCRWNREKVIERMTAEMQKLGITPDMLSGQNDEMRAQSAAGHSTSEPANVKMQELSGGE